jgi:hypothetical protein
LSSLAHGHDATARSLAHPPTGAMPAQGMEEPGRSAGMAAKRAEAPKDPGPVARGASGASSPTLSSLRGGRTPKNNLGRGDGSGQSGGRGNGSGSPRIFAFGDHRCCVAKLVAKHRLGPPTRPRARASVGEDAEVAFGSPTPGIQ